jgi:Lrp/AsnC family leucine-responsive transcriptional regulator
MQNVDSIDTRILSAMQKNAHMPIAALADHAGTSTASVQRRLKRSRAVALSTREMAQLDGKKLGFGITAVVSVELERDRLDQIDAFKRQ